MRCGSARVVRSTVLRSQAMTIWSRNVFVSVAVVCLTAQSTSGEIAGRLTDKHQSVLPGVRVRISNGEQLREVVTDREGRFSVPSLSVGTYQVVAELAGFRTVSGIVALSAATPMAYLSTSWIGSSMVQGVRLP